MPLIEELVCLSDGSMVPLQEEVMRLEPLETCEECEEQTVERIWRTLKCEDAAITSRALSSRALTIVHRQTEPPAVQIPTPVRRSSEHRLKRITAPTWVDGLFAEMKATDANHQLSALHKKRVPMSPCSPRVSGGCSAKRQRWTVEDVDAALGRFDLTDSDKACSQLFTWCPPMAPARLARHARRQAVRRTRHATARRACRDENDLRSLEQMLGRVLTSE